LCELRSSPPGILRILIAYGHIKKLALTNERCFENLISELQARERWVEFIIDLCKECEEHELRPSALGLPGFIRAVSFEFCNSNVPFDCGLDDGLEDEPMRVRGSSFKLNRESNVFKYLSGAMENYSFPTGYGRSGNEESSKQSFH